MLRLFKSNDPYLLIVVFVVLLLVRLTGWITGLPLLDLEWKWLILGERLSDNFRMYSEAFDYTAPLSAYTYKLIHWLGGRSRLLPQVVSTLLVMYQAGIFNIIMLRNKAYSENNYLPALFYVLLASALLDSYGLSPQLLSLTFILLALNNIFRRIDNEARDELFLNAGLFLGIATLFYLPAILFFFSFLGSLLLFSSPIARRLLLFFYGLFLPIVICFSYFYWYGEHWYFIDSYMLRGIFNAKIFYANWLEFLKLGSMVGILLILAIFNTLTLGRFTNYQSKVSRVMLFLALTSVFVLLVDVDLSSHHLILFVPVLSYFLAHYMLLLRRKWKKTVIPYFLLTAIVLYPYLFYRNSSYVFTSNQHKPLAEEGSLLYLGSNLSIFKNHDLASPFIDPALSQYWLEKLDYYQSASILHHSLTEFPPEVIVDEWGAIPKIFDRFPDFEKGYEPSGEIYFRKTTD